MRRASPAAPAPGSLLRPHSVADPGYWAFPSFPGDGESLRSANTLLWPLAALIDPGTVLPAGHHPARQEYPRALSHEKGVPVKQASPSSNHFSPEIGALGQKRLSRGPLGPSCPCSLPVRLQPLSDKALLEYGAEASVSRSNLSLILACQCELPTWSMNPFGGASHRTRQVLLHGPWAIGTSQKATRVPESEQGTASSSFQRRESGSRAKKSSPEQSRESAGQQHG